MLARAVRPPPRPPAAATLAEVGRPRALLSGPVIATAGQAIVYRLVVTNSGPATATAVSLVDALAGGVSFVVASSTQGL